MIDGDADCERLVCLLLWIIEIHVMGVEICGVNVCFFINETGTIDILYVHDFALFHVYSCFFFFFFK